MLSTEENRINVKLIAWMAKVFLLPFEISITESNSVADDVVAPPIAAEGENEVHEFKPKYKTRIILSVRLVSTIYLNHTETTHHVPILILFAAICVFAMQLTYMSFFKWQGYTIAILNEVLYSMPDHHPRQIRTLSKQELVGKYIGVAGLITTVLFWVFLMFNSTTPFVLYSLVPAEHRYLVVALIFYIFEILNLATMVMLPYVVVLNHILMFEMANSVLQAKIVKLIVMKTERNTENFTEMCNILRAIRRLQLNVQLFNQSNSTSIFTAKFLCINLGIFAGFGGIRYLAARPLARWVAIVTFIDSVLFFGLCYEKTFKIPEYTEYVKSLLHQGALTCTSLKNRRVMSKTLRSVPRFGIMVGSFRLFERESTPIFLHYILNHIGNLLVSTKA